MAWGFSGYGAPPSYRQPAPRRLTLEELLGEEFMPPPRPEPARSLRDLDPQARRQVQQQSIWQGLASLGASLDTGDWRHAGAGAGQVADLQSRAVEEANLRQEQEYQRQQEEAAAEIARAQKRQQAGALLGVFEEIQAAEPPDSPLVARAERAARAGSMSELQQLMGEIPKRQAAREKGYNPDAWETNARLQGELEAELKRAAAQKDWEEGERQRLEEKARLEGEAELEARLAQREAGVLWEPRETPAEAAAKAAAVAKATAPYRQGPGGGVLRRLGLDQLGRWNLIEVTPENPDGRMVPIKGQPEIVGDLAYFRDVGGRRMVQRLSRPDLGAVEMPTLAQGEEGYDPAYRAIIGAAPPADPLAPKTSREPAAASPPARQEQFPEANNLLREAMKSLAAGARPEDVEALLRQRGEADGFSPEEIFAKARALAERERRRKGARR